jgi:hypothetical protein
MREEGSCFQLKTQGLTLTPANNRFVGHQSLPGDTPRCATLNEAFEQMSNDCQQPQWSTPRLREDPL